MSTSVWERPGIVRHAGDIVRSFRHLVGRDLLPPAMAPANLAVMLRDAPFVVLSHGLEADPVLNYGNRAALALWEMDFAELTRMPSRVTAEPMLREERERLLAVAAAKGYIDDYAGVRISSSGRRFRIENARLWTLRDGKGQVWGQAAGFGRWWWLPAAEPAARARLENHKPLSTAGVAPGEGAAGQQRL